MSKNFMINTLKNIKKR